MSVAKVSEISATSKTSFEDAIQQGLARANKTIRNIRRLWIKEQHVRATDGKITEYQVNLMVRPPRSPRPVASRWSWTAAPPSNGDGSAAGGSADEEPGEDQDDTEDGDKKTPKRQSVYQRIILYY